MNLDELKRKTILVKYLVPDTLPESGLKRIQYYTNFPEEPGNFYFGLSIRTVFEKTLLRKMVNEGKLIELTESVIVPYDKDLWLDPEGRIVLALGYDPLHDEESKIVAAPSELKKSTILLNRLLDKVELPKISRKHSIK